MTNSYCLLPPTVVFLSSILSPRLSFLQFFPLLSCLCLSFRVIQALSCLYSFYFYLVFFPLLVNHVVIGLSILLSFCIVFLPAAYHLLYCIVDLVCILPFIIGQQFCLNFPFSSYSSASPPPPSYTFVLSLSCSAYDTRSHCPFPFMVSLHT